MKSIHRYKKYLDDEFDTVFLNMRKGVIKCGKYSHLVKVDKHAKIDSKTLFTERNDPNDEKYQKN